MKPVAADQLSLLGEAPKTAWVRKGAQATLPLPGAKLPSGVAAFVEYIRRRLPNTDFVTTSDVASALNFSNEWIRQLIEEGTFGDGCLKPPGLRSHWRIPREAVLAYAARHQSEAAESKP